MPALAGQAIPVTTPAERLALPDSWLHNVHRTTTGAPTP